MGGCPSDLSLPWAHKSFCWFCHAVAQIRMERCLQTSARRLLNRATRPHGKRDFIVVRLVIIQTRMCRHQWGQITSSLSEAAFCSIYEPPLDKTSKMTVRTKKTQISLGIRLVWSESSLCTQWVAKDPNFLQRFWSDKADAQVHLSLRLAHMPFSWFCHEAAHIVCANREGMRRLARAFAVRLCDKYLFSHGLDLIKRIRKGYF